jgi:hypothetical protein
LFPLAVDLPHYKQRVALDHHMPLTVLERHTEPEDQCVPLGGVVGPPVKPPDVLVVGAVAQLNSAGSRDRAGTQPAAVKVDRGPLRQHGPRLAHRVVKALGSAAMVVDLRPNGRVYLIPSGFAVVVQQHGIRELGEVLRVEREVPLPHEGNKRSDRALDLRRRWLHGQPVSRPTAASMLKSGDASLAAAQTAIVTATKPTVRRTGRTLSSAGIDRRSIAIERW